MHKSEEVEHVSKGTLDPMVEQLDEIVRNDELNVKLEFYDKGSADWQEDWDMELQHSALSSGVFLGFPNMSREFSQKTELTFCSLSHAASWKCSIIAKVTHII